MPGEVTLSWDQRPRTFDLDKLETAWLVYTDCAVQPKVAGLAVASICAKVLQDEHSWSKAEALRYTVAIHNGLWSP